MRRVGVIEMDGWLYKTSLFGSITSLCPFIPVSGHIAKVGSTFGLATETFTLIRSYARLLT